MSCRILGVIPARFASQRFPGKPLAKIVGRPMVQWVYEAAATCPAFSQVVVATDDDRIASAVSGFGGQVRMTRADHETGTDRVAEVAAAFPDTDVVVNIQGDQPFVTADMLECLVGPYLRGETPEMTTLGCPISSAEAFQDPNTVKVICDQQWNAIYFSRSAIPYYRTHVEAPVYHHLGLYGFRRDFLDCYARLTPTPLERCEQLEQLRAIEHGYQIRLGLVDSSMIEVNTPSELTEANRVMQLRLQS